MGRSRATHLSDCSLSLTGSRSFADSAPELRCGRADHRGQPQGAPDRRAEGAATRPTSDFVREAAFNLIGPVDGAAVLDLYAGLGRRWGSRRSRAAPRAASSSSPTGMPAARSTRNLDKLRLDARVLCQDVARVLAAERGAYDLVLLDPPYDDPSARPALARTSPGSSPRTACSSTRLRAAVEPELDGLDCPHIPQVRVCPPYAVRADDHRDLPRHLRPGHERPRRRDHARGARSSTAWSSASSAIRTTRRRRSRSRSASQLLRDALARRPERRGRRLQRARRRVRAPLGGAGDRQGPARDLRLRVGVPDEPAQPARSPRRSRRST